MKNFSNPGYTRGLIYRGLCSFKVINVYLCILLAEFVVAVKCRNRIQTIFRKLTFISIFLDVFHIPTESSLFVRNQQQVLVIKFIKTT